MAEVLFLNNDEQARAITAAEAIDVLEQGIRQMARGDALRRPRIDNLIPTSRPDEFFSFSSMEGGIREPGYYALRIKPEILGWPRVNGAQRRVAYYGEPGWNGGLVFLFSVASAELLAIMNDSRVQHLRVAATAAIGVKYLARPEASVVGMLGSGGMARDFAETIGQVRAVKLIKVFSPNRAHAEQYAREMESVVRCAVVPVDTAEAAVRGSHVVAACTNSMAPVLEAAWLQPGMHVCNVMSWELGPDACARIDVAGLVVRRTPPSVKGFVDDDFGIRMNAMSYAAGQPDERAKIPGTSWERQGIADRSSRYPNARYVDCVDWASGEPYRRGSADEITTLASQSFGVLEGEVVASAGIQGVQFAAIGGRIYENARRQGLGTVLPGELFRQQASS
jgi:alanine dehydrogenase